MLKSGLLRTAEHALFERHRVIWLVTDGHESIRAKVFYCQQGWALADAVDERDVRYARRRG